MVLISDLQLLIILKEQWNEKGKEILLKDKLTILVITFINIIIFKKGSNRGKYGEF